MGSHNHYKMFGCFNRKFKIKEVEPPPDVKTAFSEYAEKGDHMKADQLLKFLIDFQGEEGMTLADAERIIHEVHQRRHHVTKNFRKGFSVDDFFHFLFQDDLNGPIKTEVYHDMTAPMQHYYIYTGHNSYLTGNQLSSACSETPIIKALQGGVRGIELDLWPNPAKDNIHVLHGGTLTTPVALDTCFKAIKVHAFVKSDYPVIITLEDHLTPDLQEKVAEMAIQIFGDMLYYPESGSLGLFPSPEELKKRIILSTKPPKEYLDTKDKDKGVPSSNEKEDKDKGVPSSDEKEDKEGVPSSDEKEDNEGVPSSDEKEDKDRGVPSSNENEDKEVPSSNENEDKDKRVPSSEKNEDKDREVPSSNENEDKDKGVLSSDKNEDKDKGVLSPDKNEDKDGGVPSSDEKEDKDQGVLSSNEKEDKDREAPSSDEKEDKDKEASSLDEKEDKDRGVPSSDEKEDNDIGMPSSDENEDKDREVPSQDENDDKDRGVPSSDEKEDNNRGVPSSDENEDKDRGVPSPDENDDKDKGVPSSDEKEDNNIGVPSSDEKEDKDRGVPSSDEKEDKDSGVPSSEEKEDKDIEVSSSNEKEDNDRGMPSSDEKEDNDKGMPSSDEKEDKDRGVSSLDEKDDKDKGVPSSDEKEDKDIGVPSSKEKEEKAKGAGSSNEKDSSEDGGCSETELESEDVYGDNYDRLSSKKSNQLVAPEYKRIIAIHAGKPKQGLKHALTTGTDRVSRLSLSEQAVQKAATFHGPDLVRFSQTNILRIYPKGTRVTSTNFDPLTAWIYGAQMVAFNMQGHGNSLRLMHGLFRSNGGCGYVKKPDFLMEKGPNNEVFDPKAVMPVKKTLKVNVYLGDGWRLDFSHTHFDTYSPPDFYTKLHIVGVAGDVARKSTKVIEDEWVPHWDEEFKFQLTVPELALLRIVVREYDISEKDDFGGQTCLPVWELRPGIRSVPLYDEKGEKLKSVRLLMRFQFL